VIGVADRVYRSIGRGGDTAVSTQDEVETLEKALEKLDKAQNGKGRGAS
jgi:hypothetical protein